MGFKSDIEIAQECTMEPITKIAEKAGIDDKYLEQYGKYKAKIDYNLLKETDKKDGKLILENMGSLTQRFFRKNGAVRLNVHNKFVKVGALFDTCVFDTVSNTQDRGEGSIHNDAADRTLAIVVLKCSHVTGLVAAAFFNLELHIKLAAGKVGNDMFRIENLDIVRQIEVCSSDDAFAFFADTWSGHLDRRIHTRPARWKSRAAGG